ncbi:Phosphopantothenoylcysteine decarboxylase [Smittium mucronatum]|uniref:Phosphopantothenoylcysteine decarboxylase n=1 Tax=Smittium mucronatum TaxID=133383 RepID=A0A1R0GZX4_9FUNG|nr:Phosphopantothenoylcysteine decarboxylase [Smittium mucronatum]
MSSNISKSLNVLIGLTGSVATIKANNLVSDLSSAFSKIGISVNIQIVATESALFFYNKIPNENNCILYTDKDEWSSWNEKGDPVLHIELRKWADCLIIAPLDANTLAKIANGLCDNLLTCIIRAWDPKNPIFVCPAMNTYMYEHPLTSIHISSLLSYFHVIEPISKSLACGDVGVGAMASTPDIARFVSSFFSQPPSSA